MSEVSLRMYREGDWSNSSGHKLPRARTDNRI